MGYGDFWFWDRRVQTVNLRRYFIGFILLFAFVTIGSVYAIKTMYHDITLYRIQEDVNPRITVQEARATNVNGYIKGELVNESEEDVTDMNLTFFLYNSDNELVGTEYIDIGTIPSGQTKTYELQFRRDKIDSFVVALTNKE